MIRKEEMPKILINSVPKSGTNLLVQIINGIPNITRKAESDLFQLLNGDYAIGHIPFSKEFLSQLQKSSIKQVFIYRDIRDVTVSLRHFINDKFHGHPLHYVFKHRLNTKEQQLDALINGVDLIGEEKNNSWKLHRYPGVFLELKSIYRWVEEHSILSLRYEDLVRNEDSKNREILRIIDYLWEESPQALNDKEKLLHLMKGNINPKKSWTFRKGKIGNWKEEFNSKHKEDFKRIAGDLLISLGYEKDFNW